MLDLGVLKDFIDLGGTFILALVLLWCGMKKLDSIDQTLIRVLTLLTILTKSQTNFNGIEGVLGKNGEDVAKTILEAESGSTKD